jgi:transposase
MLRSRTVNELRKLAAEGCSIRQICQRLDLSRNTVRKYLRSNPVAAPRPVRASRLDPYKDLVRAWVTDDRMLNCVTMLERLRPLGYEGSLTILKDFVHPIRPPKGGRQAVRRFETPPGYQMQIDWGTFTYEVEGKRRRLYGMAAILGHSRMRYVSFFKRSDTASLIRAVMGAMEYFGGRPETILADRMKSVLLSVEDGELRWNPVFADFLSAIGVAPRVCRPRTPQTKGKVERSIRIIKNSFWPGIRFEDISSLNEQARQWYEGLNGRTHRTTHERPADLLQSEGLRALPEGYAWERFRMEVRRVTWDGFISFDGVLYGLPDDPLVAGLKVDVSSRGGEILVWHQGQLLTRHRVRPRSGTAVWHPDQFKNVPPVAQANHMPAPVGYQISASDASVRRPLSDYDQLFSSEVAP